MLKKMIAIFTCGILIFNMGTFAYAETTITEISIDESFVKSKVSQAFSEMELEKSIVDINLISEKAIPTEYLSEVFVEDGQHVYIYQLTDDVKSKIKVNEMTNGIKLNIVEGEKEDELTLYDNGDMVLNGNEVIFEEISKSVNSTIEPRGFTEYTTKNVPYGRASEYNYYAGDGQNGNVELGTTIKRVAIATVVSILSAKIAAYLGINIGTLGSAIFAATAALVGNPSDPLSESVSYRYDSYYHQDVDTFRINSYLSAEKVVADLYDQAYYEGNSERSIFYSCVDHS